MAIYGMTKKLKESIDHDIKEAKDVPEALFIGIITPFLFFPMSIISDTIRLPYDIIRKIQSK